MFYKPSKDLHESINPVQNGGLYQSPPSAGIQQAWVADIEQFLQWSRLW